MRLFASLLFLAIIVILGITFSMLNSTVVDLNYYVGQRSMPLSLLLVSVFTVGCLLTLLISSWLLLKIKIKNYHLRQQLKLAEKEIENLRAIPLQDKH